MLGGIEEPINFREFPFGGDGRGVICKLLRQDIPLSDESWDMQVSGHFGQQIVSFRYSSGSISEPKLLLELDSPIKF